MRLRIIFALGLIGCGGAEVSTPNDAGTAPASRDGGDPVVHGEPDYSPQKPDGGACPKGWFLWNEDQSGGTPSDRLCHKTCTSDADCGGTVPYCWTVGLTLGGDYGCNGRAKFCAAPAPDQCTR